jgi:NADH-quinone oxidoreductase subunit L
MPLTWITFGIGWLAIAAVPPLSGFWAKGDVLENTWAAHPALWGLGLLTALLTAYYMSRLTGLAFFGGDRWAAEVPIDVDTDMPDAKHAEGPIPEPHESPRIMIIPLWILAFFAAFAGLLAVSNNHLSLSAWIDPVFGSSLYHDHLSTAALWTLGITDAVIALVGVFIGLRLWMNVAERPQLEVQFLRHSWYINEFYDTIFGRPSARLAAFSADVIDPKVIDGGVNGVATLVRRSGALIRRTQTGYVRNYVLGIVLGTVLVLAFMLTRMWWG